MDFFQTNQEKRTQEYLENIKTRLVQLQESIHFFLRSINPETTPGTVSWTELHSKFNVLIAKYLHLTNILNDPRIPLELQPKDHTVFPFEPPANDQQVQTLSVLLRTKLFPELEQADEERIKEGTISGMPALPPPALPTKAVNPEFPKIPEGTSEEKRQWNAYKLKIRMHDELCKRADQFFEEQKDLVHIKVRYESDDEDDDDDDEEEEVEVQVRTENGSVKHERDDAAGAKSGSGSNKKSKVEPKPLPTDEFLGSSASVRYLDDWAGILNDVDGYNSNNDDQTAGEAADAEGEDVYNDSYFEARRQEGALDNDDDDDNDIDESSEEESESLESDESTRQNQLPDEEPEDEDAFMEVVSPTAPTSSQVSVGSIAGGTLVETGFEDDDEEEMEEVA